jgi:Predicted hydrolase (HAD superfamily)
MAIKVIAFDADDTLWDNQSYYDKAEVELTRVLSAYGTPEHLSSEMFKTEMSNMKLLGYGAKAVCISMMETALRISGNKLSGQEMSEIVSAGKALLTIPATPLPGVVETLETLQDTTYRLILLTKGDMLDQENKIERSGLRKYFHRVVIVSNKGTEEYLNLCREEGCRPDEFLMVGNSFKSDIKPVLEIGGKGIHIPFHTTWAHEVVDEFEHKDVIKIKEFSQLKAILK